MNDFESSKDTSCLEEHLSWEREELARNLRESGYSGLSPRDVHMRFGTGPNGQLLQGIFGADKAAWESSLEAEHPTVDYGPYVFRKPISYKDSLGGRRLNASQFASLYSAVAFANTLGLVMNVHVSITWGLLGFHDHTEAAIILTDRVLKPLRMWYAYQTGRDQFTWLYVHEDGRKHGLHTHLMFAIPNDLRPAFRRWLRLRLSALCRHGSIPKEAYYITAPPSDRIGRQWRYFQYLTKGLDGSDELPARVGWQSHVPVGDLISQPLENPGDVRCKKKCGVSSLIGVKARQTAGFRSLLEQGVTDVRRMYAGMEYLHHMRQSSLPMDDSVIRRLLEIEERVLVTVHEEEANRKSFEKQRRQSRKARRIALEEEALIRLRIEESLKEKARREQVLLQLLRV